MVPSFISFKHGRPNLVLFLAIPATSKDIYTYNSKKCSISKSPVLLFTLKFSNAFAD